MVQQREDQANHLVVAVVGKVDHIEAASRAHLAFPTAAAAVAVGIEEVD